MGHEGLYIWFRCTKSEKQQQCCPIVGIMTKKSISLILSDTISLVIMELKASGFCYLQIKNESGHIQIVDRRFVNKYSVLRSHNAEMIEHLMSSGAVISRQSLPVLLHLPPPCDYDLLYGGTRIFIM